MLSRQHELNLATASPGPAGDRRGPPGALIRWIAMCPWASAAIRRTVPCALCLVPSGAGSRGPASGKPHTLLRFQRLHGTGTSFDVLSGRLTYQRVSTLEGR